MNKKQIEAAIKLIDVKDSNDDIDIRMFTRFLGQASGLNEPHKKIVTGYLEDILSEPEVSYEDVRPQIDSFLGYLEFMLEDFSLEEHENSEDGLLPTFTLGKSDRTRVSKLCSDMRKIVFASSEFDAPHKRRLLNRIAAIEIQISRDRGLFDVILAGIADFGEALGKFGKEIKPLTDRMVEIRKIAQEGTPDYDQIPPPNDTKRIEDKTKLEKE
jgi:hypothetical protein